ncbi:unnamed protein product [Mytilus edulis]|uniref:Rad50/SbcC-type AAA domain-containing protein n=1 Tax=Mytilus edulis TaxID=6550 RepID=A0A8S3UIC0_MYTED|nr:unnamed protein product [Mytilus edulis]
MSWKLEHGLTSDSDYDIKLYTTEDGDESLIHKLEARTEMSMCGALMLLSIKMNTNGENLDIYQMEPEKIQKLAQHVRYCDMFAGYDEDKHPEKTILLLGATGSGKSTLIDAMFNYIAGVSSMDEFRFKLVHLTAEEKAKLGRQDVSQTNGITCYRIPWKFGSRVNFKLCVIDSPGFGDSRGLEFDKAIPEMEQELRRFFYETTNYKSISLANTKAVLDTRDFLEMKLANILKTIGNQVTVIMNIKQDKLFIAEHKEDIENNKNFTKTYQVKLPTMVSHDYESLNCKKCNETCHERCSVIAGIFIWTCEAMTSFKCGICPGKCSTDHHRMEKFTHETKTESRSETIEELKRRYDVATEGAEGRTEMMNKNRASLKKSLKELDSILQQVKRKLRN